MTETPTDGHPGLVASEPEHCRDCWRLRRGGEGYFPTIEQAVVCPDSVRTSEAIRLSGGLTVEVQEDRLLVRRAGDVVEVFPQEVRHTSELLPSSTPLEYSGQAGQAVQAWWMR